MLNLNYDHNESVNNLTYAKLHLDFILTSIQRKLRYIENPLQSVSPMALEFLNERQISSIRKSFLIKKNEIENESFQLKSALLNVKTFTELHKFLFQYHKLKKYYFLIEKIWDRVVDSINTKSERLGPMLVGCEEIANYSYRPIMNLGYSLPPIVAFLDTGVGPSIMKFSMPLEDKRKNPAAFVKIVRTMLPSLSICPAVIHEVGHQIGFDTGANDQMKELLFRVVLKLTGSEDLGRQWSFWSREIFADFYALHHTNFSAVIGLAEVITSSPRQIHVITGSPHPIAFLRVLIGTNFCKMAFGRGPWEQFEDTWKQMFPKKFADDESFEILKKSEPHLLEICKFISKTKMKSFGGKSLYEVIPWDDNSPKKINSILNTQKNNFDISYSFTKLNPVLFFSGLRIIQQNQLRNTSWIMNKITQWLTKNA